MSFFDVVKMWCIAAVIAHGARFGWDSFELARTNWSELFRDLRSRRKKH